MRVGFQCPDNGVPILGEWEEDGSGEVSFSVEDASQVVEVCGEDALAEAETWCEKRSGLIFESEHRANAFLEANGITECWGHW